MGVQFGTTLALRYADGLGAERRGFVGRRERALCAGALLPFSTSIRAFGNSASDSEDRPYACTCGGTFRPPRLALRRFKTHAKDKATRSPRPGSDGSSRLTAKLEKCRKVRNQIAVIPLREWGESEVAVATPTDTFSPGDTDGAALSNPAIIDNAMAFSVGWLDMRLGDPRSSTRTKPVSPDKTKEFAYSAMRTGFVRSGIQDADCTRIPVLAGRHKVQNDIAQRNYRKKPRRRFEDIERRAGTSGGPTSGAQRSSGSASSHSDGESSSCGGGVGGRRRKRAADDKTIEEEDGGGGTKRQGKRPTLDTGNGGIEKMKLACPYYKHNPRRYRTHRPCCGPGWDFVHRIKEHLYRRHALPKYNCPRCCRRFEVEDELNAHARAAEPCEVHEPELSDGFTQAQEKRLRSRKKDHSAGRPDQTEPEKWRQMYRILFPDVPVDDIPSPYYEDNDLKRGELEGFEDYLRRELPPLVRRQLEREVERELNFVEEGLKRRVVEMIHSLQLTLFQSYRKLEGSEESRAEAAGFDCTAPSNGSVAAATTAALSVGGVPVAPAAAPDRLDGSDVPTTATTAMGAPDGCIAFDQLTGVSDQDQGFAFLAGGDFEFIDVLDSGALADTSTMASDSGYISGSPEVENQPFPYPDNQHSCDPSWLG